MENKFYWVALGGSLISYLISCFLPCFSTSQESTIGYYCLLGFLDVHDMVFKHTIFMFSYYDCNKQFEMCLLFCIILHFIYKYDFS